MQKGIHVRWKQGQQGKGRGKRPRDTSGPPPSPTSTVSTNVAGNEKWLVLCTMLKYNREQLDASRLLSERLGVDMNAVSYAGIKDKRALTVQRCSIAFQTSDKHLLRALGVKCSSDDDASLRVLSAVYSQLSSLSNPALLAAAADVCGSVEVRAWQCADTNGIAVGNISFQQDGQLRPGDLWGNAFTICVRHALASPDASASESQIHQVLADRLAAAEAGGVPNFFGSQRMGEVYRGKLISLGTGGDSR